MHVLTSSYISALAVSKNIPKARMETHFIEDVNVYVVYFDKKYADRVMKILKPLNIYTELKERDWWKHEATDNQ
ncbi:hypothetical protein M3196_00350 [Fictibacillus nanhaiensis]|uniref:hypothetical protein n=1 Tax=Fictibacillus nanhaiensis TaxID=742169 RepID=UPI0020401C6D|nr:hypothetical protein [Fictibacillus nanhaiensis]MCM3730118.1 hypothetical protein [Fictibacillus nanhaiensis]